MAVVILADRDTGVRLCGSTERLPATSGPLALAVDRLHVRDRATLVALLDEVERTLADDGGDSHPNNRTVLHGLRAEG